MRYIASKKCTNAGGKPTHLLNWPDKKREDRTRGEKSALIVLGESRWSGQYRLNFVESRLVHGPDQSPQIRSDGEAGVAKRNRKNIGRILLASLFAISAKRGGISNDRTPGLRRKCFRPSCRCLRHGIKSSSA